MRAARGASQRRKTQPHGDCRVGISPRLLAYGVSLPPRAFNGKAPPCVSHGGATRGGLGQPTRKVAVRTWLPFLKTLTTCRPFFVNFSVRGFFSFGPCVSRLVRPS